MFGPSSGSARHLRALGLQHAGHPCRRRDAQGFLVIEDFGDATFTRRLAEGADEAALYTLATDTLIALHRHAEAAAIDVPSYDAAALQREADLLIDWFLPAVTGAPAPAAVAAEYRAVWRALYPLADAAPPTLVLRDYHVDNLIELPGRTGVAACGLLDFQDALIGSPAYDLVSLVNDARRDISPCAARCDGLALSGGVPRPRPRKLSGRRGDALGPAQLQDRRHFHPADGARRQAGLSAASPAGLAFALRPTSSIRLWRP